MTLDKSTLNSFFSSKSSDKTRKKFLLDVSFLEKSNTKIYPVFNANKIGRSSTLSMTTVDDIPDIRKKYIDLAYQEFRTKFNQSPEEFMKDRKLTQTLFEDTVDTIKVMAKIDNDWKMTKAKNNKKLADIKSAAQSSKISEKEVKEVYETLKDTVKEMQHFLDTMSNINEGYGYEIKDGAFTLGEKGVAINVEKAAKTSMIKSKAYAEALAKALEDSNEVMKNIERYANNPKVENILTFKPKSGGTKTLKGSRTKKSSGDYRVKDVLSEFEGYISSIKGPLFEGMAIKALGHNATDLESQIKKAMIGDATGPKITEKLVKKTGTTDLAMPDPKVANQKINITVKNQPVRGKYSSGKSSTTSFLSTGMDIVRELSTDGSSDAASIVSLMFAQTDNNAKTGSSDINRIFSTAMTDFAIASAYEDRIDLMAFQEGVMPYPTFLDKAMKLKNPITMNFDKNGPTTETSIQAQKYISSILNGEKEGTFDYNPSLRFAFRK